MRNLPEGADLLAIARETLLRELRPLIPEHARYTLAMAANAIAIAAREMESGEAAAREALRRLERLHDVAPREMTGAALASALREHERRLAADIRSGRYDADGEGQRAVLEHLRASVIAGLRISNPKNLS